MSSREPENGPDYDPRHGIAWGPSIPRGGLPPTEEDEDAPSIRLRGAARRLTWLAVGIVVILLLLLGVGLLLYQQARLSAMQAQAQAQAVQARAQLEQANAELQVEAAEKEQALREAEQRNRQQQGVKKAPEVELKLVRVRGLEYTAVHLEGPLKGQKVRHVIFACDVVLENDTGEDLTVLSSFFSAFDGLSLVLLRDGKKVSEQSYLAHQSPMAEQQPYLLRKGKNEADLRFPIGPIAEDWAKLQVRLVGDLPGSRFGEKLESNVVNVQKVDDLAAPERK